MKYCEKKCCCICECFIQGPQGIQGPRGSQGPPGPIGRGVQIEGVVERIEDLPPSPPNGTAFMVQGNPDYYLYIFNATTQNWVNVGMLKGPQGDVGSQDPQGETGEQGPQGLPGPELIKTAYLATTRNPSIAVPDTGLEIASGARLPIRTLEATSGGPTIVQLNGDTDTIQFNETGTYEILFNFNGHVKLDDETFDESMHFVSVGFRPINSDEVYIGVNDWGFGLPHNITGMGVLQVTNIATPYELVNLHRKTLVLLGGHKDATLTTSYFTTPIMTMVIKKLN